MPEASRSVRIEVLRYRPEQEDEPVWQGYTVPFSDDMSVLQTCSTSRTNSTAR